MIVVTQNSVSYKSLGLMARKEVFRELLIIFIFSFSIVGTYVIDRKRTFQTEPLINYKNEFFLYS